MKRFVICILLVLSSLIWMSSTFAQKIYSKKTSSAQPKVSSKHYALDGYYEHGIYVGGQIGYVHVDNSNAQYDWYQILLPIIEGTGSRLFVGYRINDFIAGEVGYNWIVNYKDTSSNKDNHTKISAFDALAVGSLPFNTQWSGFVKAGFAEVDEDIKKARGSTVTYTKDKTSVTIEMAPGVSFHLTPKFSIDGSWTHFFGCGSLDSMDILGVGVTYTF